MAFSSKHLNNNNKEESSTTPLHSTHKEQGLNLTKEEVEILLITVRDTTFKGDNVEKIYNLILKIQQYYTTITR
jgi:formiminotetrahydrofolate cyclodeaminase